MSNTARLYSLFDDTEFDDGDPPEATQFTCPDCGGVGFLVWDSLYGECLECGAEVDFDEESED